jgi:tetratricopeptide (TPR) repeat protein
MMAAEAYKKGNKDRKQKDYNAAIIHYNEAIRLDPNYARAYNSRGLAKDELNDHNGAIDDYNEAIRLHPNYAVAYYNRGDAKYNMSDHKGAIDDYNEAIRLDPNDALAYNNRGDAKSALNDHKGAIDDYNHAIRLDPNDALAYINRGIAKYDMNDKKGAIDDFNEAIRIDPNDADAYNKRGDAKYDLNDPKGAIDDYNEAIRLEPDFAHAFFNRGFAKYDLNDKKGAIDDYNHAIRISPNHADAYYSRGLAKSALNDKKGAIDDFNHAIRINQNYANAYCNRGRAKFALNDHKGAIDDFNRAIRLDANDGIAYRSRGHAKCALNDLQGAIDDFDHAIRLNPNDTRAKKGRKAAMLALKAGAITHLKQFVPLGDEVVGSTPVGQHVVLPVAAASDDLSTCSVCETSFFFDYKEDKLAQRETIYRELDEAVRNVITHHRTHHSQERSQTPNVALSAASSDSKRPAISADAEPANHSPCRWRYGSGANSAHSASDICFGAVQPTSDKYATLEDIARHIVDEPSARRVYEKYDDKTGLLVACRRSDRMIDESMNRDDFDATPVLLHCGHTVCRGCAYKCVRAHENAKHDTMFAMVDCPTHCNRQTAFVCDLGVEWLPIDTRRIRLLQDRKQQRQQKSHTLMCSEHKDRVATVRCTHPLCGESSLMCADCNTAEHSSRNGSKHVRVPPSAVVPAPAVSSSSLCTTHQQPLTGVCLTDSMPVCNECLYDHIGHEVKRLHEVCSDWSKKLETLQRETLIRAHVLSDRAACVQDKFDDIMCDITTHCDSIVQSVMFVEINLLSKLVVGARCSWKNQRCLQLSRVS